MYAQYTIKHIWWPLRRQVKHTNVHSQRLWSDRPIKQPVTIYQSIGKQKKNTVKKQLELAMLNNKSWTFSIFRSCHITSHHSLLSLSLLCTLGIPEEGKILPYYFVQCNISNFSCISKGNWQKGWRNGPGRQHTIIVYIWQKSFSLLFRLLLCCCIHLVLSFYVIIFARMYGPFDHLGIRHSKSRLVFRRSISSKRTQTESFYVRSNCITCGLVSVTILPIS